MKKPDQYKTQILKWTCIGLLIRLALMPFTMHGQDLFFINYFPMQFVTKGIWDPYGFISTNFPHFNVTYYGPVFFAIMSIANFIIFKLFNPVSLLKILELSSTMVFNQSTTTDYISAFLQLDLFWNLFLMKIPYLVFDFLIGAILLKLAISKKMALSSYRLWMLNIVVLQSTYAVGGFHLLPAFFIIASLYAAVEKRPYLSIILLILGGATKLFPYILLLPTSLLLADNWKKRFLLLFTAGGLLILIYLPFYLSSGSVIFQTFTLSKIQYPGIIKGILTGIFVVLYSFISISAAKDSHTAQPEEKLLYYFMAIIFLTYAVFAIRFRYFVSITPLLALTIPRHKRFAIFNYLIILLLAFLWLTDRSLQLGLFAPINPEYFLNLPTIQEILGRFVNMEIVYKIMARASLLCLFIAAWWIWRIKLNAERQVLEA